MLQLQRVQWDKLVVGEVYLIAYLNYGRFKYSIDESEEFDLSIKGRYKGKIEDVPYPLFDFDYLTPELNEKYKGMFCGEEQGYYRLVSQKDKIQSSMEQRALELILHRLTGDECFEC